MRWTWWKRPWCWERLKAGGEGGNRGWDGWMASPPQWTWVWANSKRSWGTGKLGVLWSMGSQRGRHNLATKQQYAVSNQKLIFPIRLRNTPLWWSSIICPATFSWELPLASYMHVPSVLPWPISCRHWCGLYPNPRQANHMPFQGLTLVFNSWARSAHLI